MAFNPEIIVIVKNVETSQQIKSLAIATVEVLDSNNENFILGQEYKFLAKSYQHHKYGNSCVESAIVGQKIAIDTSRQPEISEKYKSLGIIGKFVFMSVQVTENSELNTVNKALKTQPTAARDAASGAP